MMGSIVDCVVKTQCSTLAVNTFNWGDTGESATHGLHFVDCELRESIHAIASTHANMYLGNAGWRCGHGSLEPATRQ